MSCEGVLEDPVLWFSQSGLLGAQPRGDPFCLNTQMLSGEHHRSGCTVTAALTSGKEKGNMLLFICSAN